MDEYKDPIGTYDDQLPVDEEWVRAHEGERWSFLFTITLDELVMIDGFDGLNNYCDDTLGVILTELVYTVEHDDPDPEVESSPDHILLRVTGTVADD